MKTLNFSISISDEAFELLKNISKRVYVEYRDHKYETLKDFLKSDEHLVFGKTSKWFMSRNFNGTYHLIDELLKHNLVDYFEDSWHLSFSITEVGEKILKNNL